MESWFGYPTTHVKGRILVWEPPRLLEHEWNIEPSEEIPDGELSIMRWEILENGMGSILKLTHTNLSKRTASGMARGLDPAPAEHLILDRLEEFLADSKESDSYVKMKELIELYHKHDEDLESTLRGKS